MPSARDSTATVVTNGVLKSVRKASLRFLMDRSYGEPISVFHAMSKTAQWAIAFMALAVVSCAVPRGQSGPSTSVPVPAGPISPSTPLTSSQREWIEKTLASLSLHDRVGQMVMEWVLGDYTNVKDSSYA